MQHTYTSTSYIEKNILRISIVYTSRMTFCHWAIKTSNWTSTSPIKHLIILSLLLSDRLMLFIRVIHANQSCIHENVVFSWMQLWFAWIARMNNMLCFSVTSVTKISWFCVTYIDVVAGPWRAERGEAAEQSRARKSEGEAVCVRERERERRGDALTTMH